MCGICGFNWEDKKVVKEMTDLLFHRGPNQYDYYTDSLVSLGHRRLNIIDLSEKGKQPMCNEDGTIWIIYNGEIYNFKEIKNGLEKKRHIFKSDTDTEVIIHAYEEYGIDCINLFNGMFAFVLWDSKNKKIILARDRLGVKPLYYYFDKTANKLIFASEIKSILINPIVKREFNFNGFNQLINYGYMINGETLIKNLHEIQPGHLVIYDFKNLKAIKYWDLKPNVQYKTEDFFARRLAELLKESVKRRLVADVPLGASLSGGIDSSSIVAFMSQLIDQPVKTFTVGFNDESDEFNEARVVADYFKTDHHEIIVDFDRVTKNLPKILWHAEIPFSKPAMFSTYFLSEGISRNKVTIDLSGEGSDEIFAGYNRYKIYLNNSPLSNKEKSLKIASSPFNVGEKEIFFEDKISSDMDESLKPQNIIFEDFEKTDKKEHLNVALNFEIKKQLPGIHLLRVDKMSMAHSHEIRTPFLDYNLVEFGMTIPSRLKWNENNKKYILQKAINGLLPNKVVSRVKIPFQMPLLKYFQEDFVDVAENILLNPLTGKRNFMDMRKITEQIRKIKSGEDKNDESLRKILFLTNFEIFNKLFLEKEKISEKDLNISNFL